MNQTASKKRGQKPGGQDGLVRATRWTGIDGHHELKQAR